MIDQFKETDVRHSGVIFEGTFEQIKKLYAVDPELAGELAISAIEFVLTGEISSEDMMVGLLLEPVRSVNKDNQDKYDAKVESARMKKITDMKLDKIAELSKAGLKQREIGERLGMSQQIISYRMGVIKTSYPDLLDGAAAEEFTKNFTNTLQKNKNTNKNVCNTNTLQTNQDFTNDTKNTKDTNFVQKVVCKNEKQSVESAKAELKKLGFDF